MAKKKGKRKSSETLDLIQQTHYQYEKGLDRLYAPVSLSNEQIKVLGILADSGKSGYSLKQIQAALPNQTSNATRLVNKLHKKKFLTKKNAPGDKRELSINLTAEGRAVLQKAGELASPMNKSLKKVLKGKSGKVLHGELKKLSDKLQQFAG